LSDERILGSSAFVAMVQRTLCLPELSDPRRPSLQEILAAVCEAIDGHPTAMRPGCRAMSAARAREGVAYLGQEVFGYTGRAIAEVLGVRAPAVYRAAGRGRMNRERWDRLFGSVGILVSNVPQRCSVVRRSE
jgi:hypothetical protein